ncbi:MAG: hypothetical protein AAF074_07500 [Pseudomonadota bacterium]
MPHILTFDDYDDPFNGGGEIGFDAFVLGNHEFDTEIDEGIDFGPSSTDDSVDFDSFESDDVEHQEAVRRAGKDPMIYLTIQSRPVL